MGKICEQFEAETPTDSEATHRARFEAVLDLMQQVKTSLRCFPTGPVHLGVDWRRRLERVLHSLGGGNTERLHTMVRRNQITNQIPFVAFCVVFCDFYSFLIACSFYFLVTGLGASSKRAGRGDGEHAFYILTQFPVCRLQ